MNSSLNEGLNKLRQLSNGDEDFVNEMLEIFLRTTPITLAEIEKGFKIRDAEHIASYAHKLKSSLQIMGNEEMKDLTRHLEHEAKSGTAVEILLDPFAQLQDLMEDLNSAIQEKLSN